MGQVLRTDSDHWIALWAGPLPFRYIALSLVALNGPCYTELEVF